MTEIAHPTYDEVRERLLRDHGARQNPLQRLVEDSHQAIVRLTAERNLLNGQGHAEAALEINPQIRAHQEAALDATRQLKALQEEHDLIAHDRHPELRTALIRASASEPARLRASQETEYEAAHSAFASVVKPEVQANFENLVAPLVTPGAKAAATRLLHAAHALDRDAPTLAKILVVATAAPRV